MAGAGYYGYGSNSDRRLVEESPDEQQRRELSEEMEKAGLNLPETCKLSPLSRKKNKNPKKDKSPKKVESPVRGKPEVEEFFGSWERSEKGKQIIVVIGVNASTETEYAFQRKCPSILYRCYKYNTPFYR